MIVDNGISLDEANYPGSYSNDIVLAGSTLSLINVTMSGKRTSDGSPVVQYPIYHYWGGGSETVINSIIRNYEGTVQSCSGWSSCDDCGVLFSNYEGTCNQDVNINTDPLFVDEFNGNYTLQENSECIDTGTTDVDSDGDDDLFFITDYFGLAPDMGGSETNYCSSNIYDECGVCEGVCNTFCDECGVCEGGGVIQDCGCGTPGEYEIPDGECDCAGNLDLGCGCGEGAPSGCDNTCGSTLEFDCMGACGGDAELDCAEECEGTSIIDECGVCGGDCNTFCDCAGVCGGDAELDCAEECEGTSIIDECGVCGGSCNTFCDCAGVCEGDGVIQECGCGSPGEYEIPDGACNCEGTSIIDECGACGGDCNTFCDECGVCGGDCNTFCDICGVCEGNSLCNFLQISNINLLDEAQTLGTLDISINTNDLILGFQFYLSGLDIISASGGMADVYDFEVVTQVYSSNSVVLGFSFVGAALPAGDYVLTQLSFENYLGDEICFDETPVLAGEGAVDLYVAYGDCVTPFVLGDVNEDGSINVLDVVTLVNIILDQAEPTPYGDINIDGSLDILDVVALVNMILNG